MLFSCRGESLALEDLGESLESHDGFCFLSVFFLFLSGTCSSLSLSRKKKKKTKKTTKNRWSEKGNSSSSLSLTVVGHFVASFVHAEKVQVADALELAARHAVDRVFGEVCRLELGRTAVVEVFDDKLAAVPVADPVWGARVSVIPKCHPTAHAPYKRGGGGLFKNQGWYSYRDHPPKSGRSRRSARQTPAPGGKNGPRHQSRRFWRTGRSGTLSTSTGRRWP